RKPFAFNGENISGPQRQNGLTMPCMRTVQCESAFSNSRPGSGPARNCAWDVRGRLRRLEGAERVWDCAQCAESLIQLLASPANRNIWYCGEWSGGPLFFAKRIRCATPPRLLRCAKGEGCGFFAKQDEQFCC